MDESWRMSLSVIALPVWKSHVSDVRFVSQTAPLIKRYVSIYKLVIHPKLWFIS